MASQEKSNSALDSREGETIHAVTGRVYSGPIPSAEELGKYEKVEAGLGSRIVGMAEKQLKNRIFIEKTIVEAGAKHQGRGQVFAFIIFFIALTGGVYLLSQDKNASGFTMIIAALGTTLTSLFTMKKKK